MILRKALLGGGVGLLLVGILPAALVIPRVKNLGNSVVFLRTTFPEPVIPQETPQLQEPTQEPTLEPAALEFGEDELIAMLLKDHSDLTYEKVEAKEQWQVVHMRVTGYCPCSKCCGSFADGRTANNHLIRSGDKFVAADKSHPFGTEIIIPGYNTGQPVKVMDRGKAIKGDRLDVFFHSHQQAREWGVQYLDVLVKGE